MERLTPSTVGPSGAVLRFGYVPPSLQRLQGEQRGRRAGLVLRLAIAATMAVTMAVSAYTQLRPAAPAYAASVLTSEAPNVPRSLVSVIPTIAPLAEKAAVAEKSSGAGQPLAPLPAPTESGTMPEQSPSLLGAVSTAPLVTFPSDTVLPPRGRVAAIAQSRLLPPTPVPVPPLDTAALGTALLADTAASEGSFGISVIDLNSKQTVELDATSPMNAASVNKLEILAALYHECAVGRLRMDTTLTTSAANLQDYGTGVIRYQPLGTRYTLAQLAELLIEQSDNTASFMLGQAIGLDTIDALVRSWGLTSTVVGQEVSSPHDAARFMQLLYEGTLANAADTQQMMSYLTHTAFNDRIPAGVPGDIPVAHKIGTQVNVENDVAIVALPGRPYILSIFAKDVTEEHAVPVEQAISRTVYQYELLAKGGS